jgi:hypothetical protein
MPAPKRLVIFAEGQGGVQSTKKLVYRLLDRSQGREHLFVDDHVIQVGGLTALVNRGGETDWVSKVKVAAKRGDVGAMLLVLDGDFSGKSFQTTEGRLPFCAKTYAALLAKRAREAGAGNLFSLGVVITRAEFESWLIAGCPELAKHCQPHESADFLENGMKGAKKWISERTKAPYKPTRHQDDWASQINLNAPLLNDMRSFKRMCHAVEQLVQSVRDGRPVCTP